MILAIALAVSAAPSHVALSEGHWASFRGPNGDGTAEGSPPIEWSEEKNIRWKTPVPGKGTSSAIVWGDRVFVTTAVGTGNKAEEPEAQEDRGGRGGRGGFMRSTPREEQDFLVLALDRASGSVVWERKTHTQMPHQGTHRDGSYASPTLVTDGELVIASFGSYGLFALDFDGKSIWRTDLGDMDITNSFGEGSSPLLYGNSLVVAWDHNGDSFIVALDKKSGKELWRTPRDTSTNWTTPIVVEGEDGPLVVVGSIKTVAYDLRTGKERWSYGEVAGAGEGPPDRGRGGDDRERRGGQGGAPGGSSGDGSSQSAGAFSMLQDQDGGRPQGRGGDRWQGRGGSGGARGRSGVIATPVYHGGIVVITTGHRGGSFQAVEPSGAEGTIEAALWTHDGDTPHIPSPVAHDGILYSLKSNSGLLSAFDVRSGEQLYGPERMKGVADCYASPIIAGGHIYFTGRDGTFEVVAAGPEFRSVAVNTLEDEFDATPAIAGDEIFLRGRAHVYCVAKTD